MASEIQTSHAISAAELARTLGSARHPLVVDVRRQAAFSASQHLICGSLSNWWKGGGEGSVHSSVVAPGPHGLAGAGTLRAKAWNTP